MLVGPPLRKTRAPALLEARTRMLVKLATSHAAHWLHQADILTEGSIVGRVYYGTLYAVCARHGDAETLAWATKNDPWFRLLLLRLARREAALRAGPVGAVHAEVFSRIGPQGSICIEVQMNAELVGEGWFRVDPTGSEAW